MSLRSITKFTCDYVPCEKVVERRGHTTPRGWFRLTFEAANPLGEVREEDRIFHLCNQCTTSMLSSLKFQDLS